MLSDCITRAKRAYLASQTLCALRFWVGPGARLVKSARVAGDAANSKTAQ